LAGFLVGFFVEAFAEVFGNALAATFCVFLAGNFTFATGVFAVTFPDVLLPLFALAAD
jgi:hypothetical protein